MRRRASSLRLGRALSGFDLENDRYLSGFPTTFLMAFSCSGKSLNTDTLLSSLFLRTYRFCTTTGEKLGEWRACSGDSVKIGDLTSKDRRLSDMAVRGFTLGDS